jgi:hypothetical protein
LNEYRYSQEREYDLYQREFYHLKDHGFIGPPEREFYKAMNGMNLVRVVTPTPLGQEYIKLRVELRGLDVIRDWLEPNKRENLNVDAARKLGINLLNTQ